MGLDNGTVVVFVRETDEARTLTKVRTLTLGVNMGRVRVPADNGGVPLGPRGVAHVAVCPSEEGLAVCTRDRQLLLVNTVGLLEGTQVQACVPADLHGLALPCGRWQWQQMCCNAACQPSPGTSVQAWQMRPWGMQQQRSCAVFFSDWSMPLNQSSAAHACSSPASVWLLC